MFELAFFCSEVWRSNRMENLVSLLRRDNAVAAARVFSCRLSPLFSNAPNCERIIHLRIALVILPWQDCFFSALPLSQSASTFGCRRHQIHFPSYRDKRLLPVLLKIPRRLF